MRQRSDKFPNLTILFADASEGAHRLMPLLLEGCVSGRLFVCRDAATMEDALEGEAFDLVIVNGDRREAIGRLNALIQEVLDLVRAHMPEIDLDDAKKRWDIDVRGCLDRPI